MAGSQLRRATLIAAFGAAICLGQSVAALAADSAATESRFQLRGFASIVAGRTYRSSPQADYSGPSTIDSRACPCYIADWNNGGVYDADLSFAPESRAGIQLTYRATNDLHFVAQAVTRGSHGKPSLQWAYGRYALDDHWEVQLGRMRVPLYYYSDFQDVGAAYPWIGTPPELYGWEVNNFNGASLRYRNKVAGVNLAASMFSGKETVHDSAYYALFTEGTTDVSWRNIVGADLEASRGPLTVRAVYLQAQVNTANHGDGLADDQRLRAYGVAANLDFGDWFVLTEATRLTRRFEAYRVTGPAFTAGAGYRWGNWTPFINFASFTEHTTDLDWYEPSCYQRTSLTVRYDIDGRSSVKAQLDAFKDTTHNLGDDSKVIRLAYDRLF
jgi:hypothetical protein